MEAIVLVGGLGTRLRSVLDADTPKPLAPVNDLPFLYYLLARLKSQGVTTAILSCGYNGEAISSFVQTETFKTLGLRNTMVFEDPTNLMGTGGAVLNAVTHVKGQAFWVINGDTYIDLHMRDMWVKHFSRNSDVTIALREFEDATRYGTVDISDSFKIRSFQPKGNCGTGLISAGYYVFTKNSLSSYIHKAHASLEHEIIPDMIQCGLGVHGYQSFGYFIDIGVPSDYEQFGNDVKNGLITIGSDD